MSFRLKGERLCLRLLTPADGPTIAAYRNDPQVARYQGWDMPYTLDAAETLIRERSGRLPGDPGWAQVGIEECGGGHLIGDLGLNTDGLRRQAELGFTLAGAAQGRGYAQEAARLLLAHAFGTLHLHRVHASIDPRNEAAARLLLRLDFRHEGTALESYWHRGVWTDDARYALLEREWKL
ncbi:GNAT family N-acetyltransferase [Deinococcus sp.]|uniref:GNAT family N-acetyltransferase n=1 Tax=Deinococcus sp. TaxID=47478 RepID=UPI003CC52099